MATDPYPLIGEFKTDARCRPLVSPAHFLGRRNHVRSCGRRLAPRRAAAVFQPELTKPAVPVHPLGGVCPRDPHFRCDMGDRTRLTAGNETTPALNRQRGITVGYWTGSFSRRTSDWRFSSCRRGPVLLTFPTTPTPTSHDPQRLVFVFRVGGNTDGAHLLRRSGPKA